MAIKKNTPAADNTKAPLKSDATTKEKPLEVNKDPKVPATDKAPLKPLIKKATSIDTSNKKVVAKIGKVAVQGVNQTVKVSNETAKIIKGFKK